MYSDYGSALKKSDERSFCVTKMKLLNMSDHFNSL